MNDYHFDFFIPFFFPFSQEFLINEKNKKVPVAGCRCTKGSLKKGKEFFYKVIRAGSQQGIVDERFATFVARKIPIASLRHLKNEVDAISKDMECGLRLDFNAAADLLIKEIAEREAALKIRAQNNLNLVKKDHDQDNIKSNESFSGVTPDDLRDLRFVPGDRIVCYQIQRVKQKTTWTPDGF